MAPLIVGRAIARGLRLAAVSSLVIETGITSTGEPAAGLAAGDLSHLVYTTTTGLVARAVYPQDGAVVNSRATAFEVIAPSGAGVEIRVNGEVVPVKRLGKRAVLDDGTVHYTFYGVVLAPGPNDVVLTALGAAGLRGPSVTEHIWGPGAPAAIRVTGCRAPRADGRTPCVVRIVVLDAWNHPAEAGSTVKAAITEGDAALIPAGVTGGDVVADSAPITGETTLGKRTVAIVLTTGSSATIQLVPGTLPGHIRVSAGIGEISGSAAFDALAFARPPFVTGLATVGAGAVPGDLGTDPTAPDGTNSRYGRVALYGTGALVGNAVGSIAYDTAGSLAATPSSGAFTADPNDRPYTTYGDASIRRNDALTEDRLYARIDDGFSNAMWGEFEATTGPAGDVGSVAMQVDGAKVVAGSATTKLGAFTAANRIGYGRQLLDPTGLATLDSLAHDNLIIGSETVTLVSVDRRTGVILKQTTLQNLVDYTIDYTSGILHFINVPLPYDASFNPQQVLVTYEYSSVGESAKTTGVRFDSAFGRFDGIKFGAGYLNDVTGSSNFALLSENISGLLPGGSWSVSHATSDGFVPGTGSAASGSGSAFRFTGATGSGPYKLALGYDTTSGGYDNPFGDVQIAGLTGYHAALIDALPHHGDFSIAYDREQNAGTGTFLSAGTSAQSTLAAILHEKFGSRFLLRAGVSFHESSTLAAADVTAATAAPSTIAEALQRASVTQANLGLDWKATRALALSVERDQDVGGSDATQPAQTSARVSWDLNGRGQIFAQELITDAPTRTFGTLNDIASATHQFELGVVEKVTADTSFESTYNIAGTGNAADITSAIGVTERLHFFKRLTGDAFVQRGAGSGTTNADFLAYGISLAYADPYGRLKTTGSVQLRTGAGNGATWSFGAAARITDDISLLGSDIGSRMPGTSTADTRVGIAWRPSTSDRGAMLAGYERSSGNADVAGAQSGVASLDGVYRPTRRLELSGRYARKIDGDSNYVVGTSLVGFGARQQIGPRFDVGIEMRELLAPSTATNLHTMAAEVGSLVTQTLRAAFGYNFGATADPTLANAPTRKGFYATLTTTIDRIFGWGRAALISAI